MKYDFDDVPSREGTNSVKYDLRERVFGSPDVIPMWVADMDFKIAPQITEALRRRLDTPLFGYEVRGDGFFDSARQWLARRGGWRVERRWIDFSPGVVAGLAAAIGALSERGDGVVIQPPVYPTFASTIRGIGRTVVDNPLVETPQGWRVDLEDLDRKLSSARLMLLCNPHNPTGRVFTREELTAIGELCCKHDAIVISDEIHCDIVQKPYHHIHLAALDERFAARCVTFIAPSKSFNLAGMATSISVTSDDGLRRRLHAALASAHLELGNAFGNAAFQAAYDHGEEWLEEMVLYVGANMDYVLEFLARRVPQITSRRSEGTYMMWLDMRGLNMEHEDVVEFIIRKAGLGLNEGLSFGEQGRGFMRMNLATSRATVERAMAQLEKAVIGG